jgi:hypothetical protein
MWNMKYSCPHCDQNSPRLWNLQTHIKRKHGGTGSPIPNMPNSRLQSPGKPMPRYPNNAFSTSNNDPLDLQWTRDMVEFLRSRKELIELLSYFSPGGLSLAQPMNVGFSDGRNILGYKGHVCKKCLSFEFRPIFDDVKGISLKSNHVCNPQKLSEALHVTEASATINKRRQELISCLTVMLNGVAKQAEVIDLTAVEVPASVFDIRSNNYEDYVDLDSVQSDTLGWAYHAAKGGKTTINRRDLQEFLFIFEATLGFFSLTIDGVKRYFFVYIENGLETSDIRCLKLLRVESPTTTEIGIKMSYFAITNEEWKDMFMDGQLTSFPPLRPDKFNFLSRDPTTFDVSKNEVEEIRERQEYADRKSLMQTNG